MLHGKIMVNDVVIGHWAAVRVHAKIEDVNTYRCEVEMDGHDGGGAKFTLLHTYADGALVLASKVLARAHALGVDL